MGADGAVNILYGKQMKAMEDPETAKQQFVAEFQEKFSKPYAAAASGHVDDILIPSETRSRLIAALELLRDKKVSSPAKKHGNMPM